MRRVVCCAIGLVLMRRACLRRRERCDAAASSAAKRPARPASVVALVSKQKQLKRQGKRPKRQKQDRKCILCSQCLLQQPTFVQDRQFRGLVQLNSTEGRSVSRLRHRLALEGGDSDSSSSSKTSAKLPFASASRWFPSDKLEDRLARALAAEGCIDMKEWTESFEFFTRCRKAMVVRAASQFELADLCCGHGLTGVLWAVFERRVARVVLVDERRPEAHGAVMRATCKVAPWAREKVGILLLLFALTCL